MLKVKIIPKSEKGKCYTLTILKCVGKLKFFIRDPCRGMTKLQLLLTVIFKSIGNYYHERFLNVLENETHRFEGWPDKIKL